MPDETTFELASVQFGAEPVAVFRFGYEHFELRARLGSGNLEHAIASAAEVAASVFARWSHEALAFAAGTALHAPQLPFAIAVGMALLGDGKQSIACLKPSDAVAYG